MATSVLIVEDEPEFLQGLTEAVIGDPGLGLLDAQPPDVMLVDLGLPDIDGIELIRHAARHRRQCGSAARRPWPGEHARTCPARPAGPRPIECPAAPRWG